MIDRFRYDLQQGDFIIARGYIPGMSERYPRLDGTLGWLRFAEVDQGETFPYYPKSYTDNVFETREMTVYEAEFPPSRYENVSRYPQQETPVGFVGELSLNEFNVVLEGELFRSGRLWGKGLILDIKPLQDI
jgi:hypothetical protein